jgi:hypothetical protein
MPARLADVLLQAEEAYGATILRTEHELRNVGGHCKFHLLSPDHLQPLSSALLCCRCHGSKSCAKCLMLLGEGAARAWPPRSVWWPTRTSKQLLGGWFQTVCKAHTVS